MKRRTAFLAASCAFVGAALVYITVARAIPPSTPYDANRGEDAAIWQSSSQTQIRELIDRHITDPKAMYRLINESYGKEQEAYVANDLLKRLQKDAENPKLTIITAYALVQASGDGSRALWQPSGPPESKSLIGRRSYIFSLVTPDIWKGLDDPALMVMAAAGRGEKIKESVDENMKPYGPEASLPLVELCRRATLLDPKWADAHYWYGKMLLNHFYDFDPKEREGKRELLLTAKAELLKASKLDAGLKSDCYWQLTFVLEDLGQPKEALSHLEQALKLRRRGYGINPELIGRTRKRLQEEIRAQQNL